MVTYDFDYSAKNDLLNGLTLTQSKSANALIIHPIQLDRIGIPWDGTSVAGFGLGRLNNFNGYPLKNIGWTMEIGGARGNANGGVGETIGIRLRFNNADVMDITYRNDLWHFKYTTSHGSYTTCGLGQGVSESNWLKITSTINGNDRRFKFEWADNLSVGNTYPPSSPNYTQFGADPFFTVTGGKGNWITDMYVLGETDNPISIPNGGDDIRVLHLETSGILFTSEIVGIDASIVFNSYYLRTALNGGGNGIVLAPNPFYSDVSATTLKAQLKKSLTYTNVFGIKQWQGETTTAKLSTHNVIYECEEMIRKTMFTEVGFSPVIFSTVIRNWNGLVIEDKDGNFINRGVTNSHIVSFQKADTKVYEGRITRDAFTVVDEDFSTPFVPAAENNGKDEEAYYKDVWDTDDTDKAHIMIDNSDTEQFFHVKYPTDLYEKFNNLTKLNKLEINCLISAIRRDDDWADWTTKGGDDGRYRFFIWNYHTSAWDNIINHGKSSLKASPSVASIVNVNYEYYAPTQLRIDIGELLKDGVDEWLVGTGYVVGDRVLSNDILYTCVSNSTGDEPPNATFWQRTVYDYINYESTAGSASIFSKLNIQVAIRSTKTSNPFNTKGFWIWDYSVKSTFDEDNNPEYSSATIASVTDTTITLNATSGINLPEKDGFGVGDLMAIVKSAEDYLQDTWDLSDLATNLGALIINITNGTTIGVSEDHTYKSFFTLMQHIGVLTNSTFWADYDDTNTVLISSADNHIDSGVVLQRFDILGYNENGWSVTYDATTQRNKLRIIGNNVNFVKVLTPVNDPFDLGDETEIIDDPDIQTLLQASDQADSLTPRRESSEIIAIITLDYSNPVQNYGELEVGKEVTLQLPTTSDPSICDFSAGNEGRLIIAAEEVNRNEETGDKEHVTFTLQRRYS